MENIKSQIKIKRMFINELRRQLNNMDSIDEQLEYMLMKSGKKLDLEEFKVTFKSNVEKMLCEFEEELNKLED